MKMWESAEVEQKEGPDLPGRMKERGMIGSKK